jgi:ABC-2 type transport system permease protein/sodium transport system permease protein
MFPLYFVTANLLSLSTLSVLARLFVSASATVLLFGLLPVALVLYQRIPLASAFRLRSAGVVSYVAAAILGLTLWPLAHEVFLLNRTVGIATLTEEQIQAAQKLVASWKEISPAVVLVTLALVPAVCEELFFRGYLFGAFRRVTSPAGTILFTAVLFGIFHVVVTSMLAVERFLPSTFLGLLLGWVCWRSESTIPGMVLHALHNGLLLMMAYYQTDLKAMGWGIQEQQHLPVSWVAATFAGVLVGVVTLFFSTSPPADGLPPQSQELSMAETSTLP